MKKQLLIFALALGATTLFADEPACLRDSMICHNKNSVVTVTRGYSYGPNGESMTERYYQNSSKGLTLVYTEIMYYDSDNRIIRDEQIYAKGDIAANIRTWYADSAVEYIYHYDNGDTTTLYKSVYYLDEHARDTLCLDYYASDLEHPFAATYKTYTTWGADSIILNYDIDEKGEKTLSCKVSYTYDSEHKEMTKLCLFYNGAPGFYETNDFDKDGLLRRTNTYVANEDGQYIVLASWSEYHYTCDAPMGIVVKESEKTNKDRKIIENGQVIILRNGVRYNILGQVVE